MSRRKRKLTAEELEAQELESRKNAYDWIQCLASALIVCVVIFIFVARVIDVKGTSMYPTLNNQDKMLVSDLFYTPKAGTSSCSRRISTTRARARQARHRRGAGDQYRLRQGHCVC